MSVLNLPIKMILTSHGLSWRTYADKAIESYISWARGNATKKVLIGQGSIINEVLIISLFLVFLLGAGSLTLRRTSK